MGSQALFAARHLDHHETYTRKYFHHLLSRELLFKWLDCYADQIDLRCHGIHYHAFLLGSTLLRVLCKDGPSLAHFKATYDRTTHSVTE